MVLLGVVVVGVEVYSLTTFERPAPWPWAPARIQWCGRTYIFVKRAHDRSDALGDLVLIGPAAQPVYARVVAPADRRRLQSDVCSMEMDLVGGGETDVYALSGGP